MAEAIAFQSVLGALSAINTSALESNRHDLRELADRCFSVGATVTDMSTQIPISKRDLTPLKTVLDDAQYFIERCNTQRTVTKVIFRARDEQVIRRLGVRLDRAIADLNLIVATRAGMATLASQASEGVGVRGGAHPQPSSLPTPSDQGQHPMENDNGSGENGNVYTPSVEEQGENQRNEEKGGLGEGDPGGPGEEESLSAWKTRQQTGLAGQERAEQERAEQDFERREMARKGGDIGRWLHQDLGFDHSNSAGFGASLRACHLHNPQAIFAMDQQNLEGVLRKVEMPELLVSLVMEAWRRRRKEDEDRRHVEAETTLVEARQRAEFAAEERRRKEEAERTKKELQEAEALRRKRVAVAKAEAERQRLKEAALEEAALRRQEVMHTPIGRWLKMEAHFNDAQSSRFCASLEGLGINSIHALKFQERDAQQQLVLDLNMNKYETGIFMAAMQTLRSKPDVFDVPSSTANAGASFVNLVQLRDCGGMATVFTANQLIGGPESTATRPVVLKRSDKDQPAAYLRESRVLQYVSRPVGPATEYAIQLLQAYSTLEYDFIAMDQGSQNLSAQVEESKRLLPSERIHRLALWGQQACQVLVALHDLGVVWGDVKPDNFVFRRDRLVAVDF